MVLEILVGILVLIIGVFIGDFLAKSTKEELKEGKLWFKSIIIVGFIGSVISLILKNDVLFFSFLFIIIVTSRSMKKK